MVVKEFSIGIVGAGIAGCCTSYFVREAFRDNVRIVVYECEGRIGGRVHTAEFAGTQIELGAGLIHSSNRLLVSLMDRLSLKERVPQGRKVGKPLTVGIWNGRTFDLRISGSGPIVIARLACRYGLSLARLRRVTRRVVARWSEVYGLQRQNRVFLTPQELFRSLGLFELAQEETYDFLRRSRISGRVVTELFDSISRAIFNQDGAINAFAGAVALTAGGIAGGRLFSVLGGNSRFCQELLNAAEAHVETNRKIVRLRPGGLRHGTEKVVLVDEAGRAEEFDAVIITAPIETAQIDLEGLNTTRASLQGRKSQIAHVTCVEGLVAPSFFGLSSDTNLPQLILTTETQDVPFSFIGFVDFSEKPTNAVYKIQSREPLDDRLLSKLFMELRRVLRVTWKAYPVLKPTKSWLPFALKKGVYYVNAIESAVSSLETEAVASKNVVELLKRDFTTVH